MINEINAGRFQRWLTALFNIIGGAPSPQVSPEIMPVVLIEGDRPELRYAKKEGQHHNAYLVNAGAGGTYARARLNNPVGSGKVVTIELVGGANGAGSAYALLNEFGPGNLANVVPSRVRDPRSDPTSSVCSWDNTAVAINTFYGLGQSHAEWQVDFRDPIILTPGWALQIQCLDAATAFNARWVWRERPVETSEQ